jgi:hypothetical protein
MRWRKWRQGSHGTSCQQGRDCEKRRSSRNEHGLSVFVSFHFRCLFLRAGRSGRIVGESRAKTLAQRRDCPSGQSGFRQRNEEERALAGFDSKSATQNLTHLAVDRNRKPNQSPKLALPPKFQLGRLAAMQAAIRENEQSVRQSHWERARPIPCSIAWSNLGAEMPLSRNGSKHARKKAWRDFQLRTRCNDSRQKAMQRRRL